jgi:ElaB/YqjD/DUF883 family membrane-anchored ribosome-binding protein
MAAITDKDIAERLEAIRDEVTALSETVSELASHTAGIHASLRDRLRSAARSAVGEAEKLGDEAMRAAARGANVAMTDIEAEIARNPLIAALVALGLGVAIGLHFSHK